MEQDFIARTALDEMVESDRNQMLKAMIPYLPPSGQRFLSMYAKTQELINTMTLFQNRSYYPRTGIRTVQKQRTEHPQTGSLHS